MGRGQQALQLSHVLRKIVGGLDPAATQGAHGGGVGTRRTAQAQVNAPGVELSERAKRFSHHQWRVVGQHHPARADADTRGAASQVAHQHGGGRAGNAHHVVVLGQPIAGKAQFFSVLRGAQGNLQRVGHRAAFANGNQVQHGQNRAMGGGSHAPIVRRLAALCWAALLNRHGWQG